MLYLPLGTSIARTQMACLPCVTRTHSWVPMVSYETSVVKFLHLCFMLLFSFSVFSDRRSLKIENENNMKTLSTEAPYIGLESLELSL